jgi:hypothetical protein
VASAEWPVRIDALEGEIMGEEPESIFGRMYQYTRCLLALGTSQEILTWQFILVAYCQLEALAVDLLRIYEGKDERTFWEREAKGKNLNGVAKELSKKQRAPEEITRILTAVADLRNSVAHKSVLGGMTVKQQVGQETIAVNYGGTPVFDDQYIKKSLDYPEMAASGVNEATLEQLMADVDRACTALKLLRHAAALKQQSC